MLIIILKQILFGEQKSNQINFISLSPFTWQHEAIEQRYSLYFPMKEVDW